MNSFSLLLIKKKLLKNGYDHFHFGSSFKDGNILLPEIDLVFDYLDKSWFVYSSERGVIRFVQIYSDLGSLLNAISLKKL